jgi:hypothetical protein
MFSWIFWNTTWWNFFHYWIIPLYTYWYYIGPLIIVAFPLFRFLLYTVKKILKLFYYFVSEILLFVELYYDYYQTSEQDNYKMNDIINDGYDNDDGGGDGGDDDYGKYETPVSIDNVIYSVKRKFNVIQNYFVVFCVIIIIFFLLSGFFFTFYDKLYEGYENRRKHEVTIEECKNVRFSSPIHRDTCDISRKEVQKSVLFLSIKYTLFNMDKSLGYIFYSPFGWLCIFILLIYIISKVIFVYIKLKHNVRHNNHKRRRHSIHIPQTGKSSKKKRNLHYRDSGVNNNNNNANNFVNRENEVELFGPSECKIKIK